MQVDIELDVTGFYFSYKVKGISDTATIQDVMDRVQQETTNPTYPSNEPVFTYEPKANPMTGKLFVSMISIEHREQVKSRQIQTTGQKNEYGIGTYKFDDDFAADNKGRNPISVWQYYVVRKEKLISGGSAGERITIPFSETDRSFPDNKPVSDPIVFQQDDKIIWRLVGICTMPTGGSAKGSLMA